VAALARDERVPGGRGCAVGSPEHSCTGRPISARDRALNRLRVALHRGTDAMELPSSGRFS